VRERERERERERVQVYVPETPKRVGRKMTSVIYFLEIVLKQYTCKDTKPKTHPTFRVRKNKTKKAFANGDKSSTGKNSKSDRNSMIGRTYTLTQLQLGCSSSKSKRVVNTNIHAYIHTYIHMDFYMFAYYVLIYVYLYLNYVGLVIGIVELVIDSVRQVSNWVENGVTEFAINVLGCFWQSRELYSLDLLLQLTVINEFLPPLRNDLSFKLLRELHHFGFLKCMKGEDQ
jgi:hypothetical protein